MLSSHDTLQVLLSRIRSAAWLHGLRIHVLRPTSPCLIIKVLPTQNFLNHLVIVVCWTALSPFAQQLFLVTSTASWPSLNLLSISSLISLHYIFICVAFKSHMEWNNAQPVSTLTTMIVITTSSTYHGLNCFSHVIYAPQST